METKIDIHKLGMIAQILNRMKKRIKAYRHQLPTDYANNEVLDINDIESVFNEEFKKGGVE